ncbi:uncharacterized protein LOC131674023 [Phymastichus coffea]|uniref:uncharacterized protein LOC131674023 n=1 Tax=Phymastichus coffea TaxID=108790 RepID=UPI00273ADC8B|nr:uncharacterized protein LOC131674023 [Phymastichus coffea]
MTRITRSRQTAVSIVETTTKKKTTVKLTTTGTVTKKIVGKTRSNVKKASNQDENTVPFSQINKTSKSKDSRSKGLVVGTKLLNNDEEPHSIVLGLKSPVLRDRTNTTNTTNELAKIDTVSKLPEKMPSAGNMTSNAKRTTRNAKKQSTLNINILQRSTESYSMKTLRARAKDHHRNNFSNKDLLHNNKAIETSLEEKDTNRNLNTNQEQSLSDKVKSETVRTMKKAMKRKNISVEDIERILNEDDGKEISGHETSDDEEIESIHEKNYKKDGNKTKKFFKHKGIVEEMKSTIHTKKNLVQNTTSRATKKVKNNDSTFSPKVVNGRQSIKPENRKLRTRVAKNYCETSRLSNSKNEAKKVIDKPIENDHKGVPIYKNIKLSEEEHKIETDQVYEFEASQDDGQKSKKRKKTVKRPAVKRAKKVTNLPIGLAPQLKRKSAKIIGKNVQFKVENLNRVNMNIVPREKNINDVINTETATISNNVETNYEVPNEPSQIGNSTFQEAPTIKIVSNEKLESNNRYHLTTTPAALKTAASGMRVFDHKNYNISQPNQLKKMANHSLMRESMSPIKKVIEEFDTGSPWRVPPVETFTRIRRVVQSTPQVKRQAVLYEKKPLDHIDKLNKKSFGSEETIHLSSAALNQLSKEFSLGDMSTIKQDEPRKFGTVISNLSSSKSSTNRTGSSSNSVTQKSPPQGTSLQSIKPANNQQSPVKAISPPAADPNLPVNYKKLDIEDPTISFDNKENISPKSSPKKKIVAPSPFRFEKIRSSKRLAAIASNSISPEKVSSTKIYEPDAEAGPSWLDKPKPTFMKQTNLNNFLNLVDMPGSTNIATPHGIFDDVCSTPVSGKKPRKFIEEANIENAFGFDDFDCDDASNVENVSAVKIATEADVKKSVKGKLFPKARVKSAVPSKISGNTAKKTFFKAVLKKKAIEKLSEFHQKAEEDSDSSGKDSENKNDQLVPYTESENDKKKTILDAITFSDTFDVLSENGAELEAKVPEEIPLFVDLEPVHFTDPPRRSYNKRKRNVCFDVGRCESSDDEEHEKKKEKRKKPKESHLKKEEKKRMEEWVKNVNKTFDEIEHFDLIVE